MVVMLLLLLLLLSAGRGAGGLGDSASRPFIHPPPSSFVVL